MILNYKKFHLKSITQFCFKTGKGLSQQALNGSVNESPLNGSSGKYYSFIRRRISTEFAFFTSMISEYIGRLIIKVKSYSKLLLSWSWSLHVIYWQIRMQLSYNNSQSQTFSKCKFLYNRGLLDNSYPIVTHSCRWIMFSFLLSFKITLTYWLT